MAALKPDPKSGSRPRSEQGRLARWWAAVRGPGLVGVLSRGASASLLIFVGGALAALLAQLLLARVLGAEGYGVYAFCLSLLALATMGARLGMDTGLVRFVASYRGSGQWAELLGLVRFADRLVGAMGLLLGLVGAGIIWFGGDRLGTDLRRTLLVACAVLPALALLGLRSAVMQGFRRVAIGRLPELLVRPLLIAGSAFAIHRGSGGLSPAMAMGLNCLSTLLALVAGTLLLRRVWPRPSGSRTRERIFRRREWLRVSLPLLLVTGMRRLLAETDILLVGLLMGTTMAGIYAVASRLSNFIAFGHNAGNVISAPLIAELHAKGERRRLQRMVTLATWGSTLSAAASALLLILLGGPVLRLFGAEFTVALPVLAVLCVGQMVNAMTGPVGT